MKLRRTLLVIGLLGMIATAPTRVRAATELEGVGYGGSTVGRWACGPTARVNYAGGGGRVRIAEHAAPFGGTGWNGEIAGAAERDAPHLKDCNSCNKSDYIVPPESTLYAGHARGGYQAGMFGVAVGATVYQDFEDNTDRKATTRILPDAEIAFRVREKFRIIGGLGSPTVTTLLRPGLYAGGDVAFGALELGGTTGLFRQGANGDFDLRTDVVAKLPLNDVLKVRVGGAASYNDSSLGGEGSLGLIAGF